MATSLPVGTCFANLTLAKLPLPIVFKSLYFPMWGSSVVRVRPEALFAGTMPVPVPPPCVEDSDAL